VNLFEAIEMAETVLGRKLTDQEILLVGQMIDADKGADEILEMLSAPAPKPPADDELKTYRYEATGDGVVEIPEPSEPPS